MNPAAPQIPGSAPSRRYRAWRLFRFLLLVAIVGLCFLVGKYIYGSITASKELAEAIAETDQVDPGWRIEELEAKRQSVPDGQNAAMVAMAAAKDLPKEWEQASVYEVVYELSEDVEPPVLLNDKQIGALRRDFKPLTAALHQARRLTDMTRGRYTVHWTPDVFSTLVPHLQELRKVYVLLSGDVFLCAQDQALPQAWASSQAILNAAGSMGDEPMLISLLVRLAGRHIAFQSMQRVLAHGEVTEKSLAHTQSLLEGDERRPWLMIVMRGERAGFHSLMSTLESGEVSLSQISGSSHKPTFTDKVTDFLARHEFKESHAYGLRYMIKAIGICNGPLEQQTKRFRELEDTLADAPVLAKLFLTALAKVQAAYVRSQAELRCALTALAVERYRLIHHSWPKGLGDLVPAQLPRVPADPFAGKPLRFRLLKDGVVIYSLGPDQEDNGGLIDCKDSIRPGTDLGFRLWAVNARRQPALPTKTKEEQAKRPAFGPKGKGPDK
jgi:hypothetical protein